jgi:hypothetical protein
VRLVTFAPILKHGVVPLPEVVQLLLDIGGRGLSGPAEIEFAVDLEPDGGGKAEFAFLQIRPVPVVETGSEGLGEFEPGQLLVRSPHALGNGRINEIRDILMVRPESFHRDHTIDIASEVERLNDTLVAEGRTYLLIGPGRWGTADRWLGIPVSWQQISGARAILEQDLMDIVVEPSQGTHFFHNMTSYGIGYFHVMERDGGRVDTAWLAGQPAATETRWLKHIRLDDPLEIRIDGKSGEGVILKRASLPAEA